MLVDPELLRAFARQVEAASSTVKSAAVGAKATTAADGLPYSTTQWAVRLVGRHMTHRSDAMRFPPKSGQGLRGLSDRGQ